MRFISKLALFLVAIFVLLQFFSELIAQEAQVKESSGTQPAVQQKQAQDAQAKDNEEEKTEFIRIRKDDANLAVAFETSIVRYEGKNKAGEEIVVDLLGAVHIAEKEYFEKLNREFTQYESLLYELVAPKGAKIEKGKKRSGFSAVSSLQTGMKDFLKLEFQLDHIDYSPKNFVHADMTPAEFSKSMKQNDESVMRIFFKMMGHGMAAQGTDQSVSNADFMKAMFAKDSGVQLRRIFARQLQAGEGMMNVFEGNDGSTIITHRNKKALSVLQSEIDKGKKKIGIFYGAGHFPDMEQRLFDDFKLKKVSEKWLRAWDLKGSKSGK